MRKNCLNFVVGGFALLGWVGCTGTPGTNPGPDPVTNPDATTNLVPEFLPDSIGLDIDELPDDASVTGKVRQLEAQTTVRYDRTVRAASHVAHAFQRFSAQALRLGSLIRNDLTSPTLTQIDGEFEVNGTTVAYRADFAPFDIDGDGIADGSGAANVEPVAVRIWTDRGDGFQPFLCALITVRPSSARTGVGEIFVRPGAADANAFQDLQLHVSWDHSDPAHTFNNAFLSGQIRENVSISIGNSRVDIRQEEDGTIEKTVRTTTVFAESPWGFESFSSAVHHMRGTQTFLISGVSTGGEIQVDFSQVCVNRSSRAKAADTECAELDTQDMTLLPAPLGTETDFPADFPSTPTF